MFYLPNFMKIVLTGGGTGGHIFPLLAVAKQLKISSQVKNLPIQIYALGPLKKQKEIFAQDNIEVKNIFAGKLRRYFSLLYIIDGFKLFIGFFQSYYYLLKYMPDIVFSKGGYGSFPVVFVSWMFRIPVIIHESDSTIGLANKILIKFSKKLLVSFPGTYKGIPSQKIKHTGNPIRDFRGGDFNQARKFFKINTSKPVILILGGSQGAVEINTLVLAILEEITSRYEVIHQTGKGTYEVILQETNSLPKENSSSYHIFDFLNEQQLKNAYTLSNLVISRAGAGAIFELALLGKPSIIIPITKSAANHQVKNATLYQKAGACILFEKENSTPHILLNQIDKLIQDEILRNSLSIAALNFAKPNAAESIAELLIEYYVTSFNR